MPEMSSNSLLISNRATGEGALHGYSVAVIHTCIFTFIAIFGNCLQLKYPNVSPYETAYGTVMMNLLITEICFYIGSLVLMAIQAASDNSDLEHLTNKIALFLGTLSLIFELLVLISPLGWILLWLWIVCLVYFSCKVLPICACTLPIFCRQVVQDIVELKHKLIALKRRLMVGDDEAANTGAIELPTQNLNIKHRQWRPRC